jgi:hypothetical protein
MYKWSYLYHRGDMDPGLSVNIFIDSGGYISGKVRSYYQR